MTDEMKRLMPDLNDKPEQFDADPAFDAWIAANAKAINQPGDTPRAEMWRRIQDATAASRDAQSGNIPGVTPLRRTPWKLMSLIAAALLLGVALDRVVLRPTGVAPQVASVPLATPAADTGVSRLYRMAASQTLTQAEALLTAYRAETERDAVQTEQLGALGRQVLSRTRLLIDSPAGDDPQLRALLEDLELVLVQIVRLSGPRPDSTDRDHVDRALKDRDLIPRIRTAVPAGHPAAATSD